MNLPSPGAINALYTSANVYRGSPPLQFPTVPLTQCDIQYDVCKDVATNDTYADCVLRCSFLYPLGKSQSCNNECQNQLNKDLTACAVYLCRFGTMCQLDVQDPAGAHPKCCPRGNFACGGACVPDCLITQRIDPTDCMCKCIPVTCQAPLVQDPVTCDCACPSQCPTGFLQDPNTCQCSCPMGFTDCSDRCVRLESDPYNCGECGVECGPLNICCGGECVPRNQDPNCGTCSNDCWGQGLGTCCNPPGQPEKARCVDLLRDDYNCGSCNHSCLSASTQRFCVAGDCICPSWMTPCDPYECCKPDEICCQGLCYKGLTDPNNCGVCGNRCSPTQQCCNGNCVDTQQSDQNCGGCNQPCPTGQHCCHGQCVDYQENDAHCGGCDGHVCGTGQHCCSGQCVDVLSNLQHCGTCGNVCPAGSNCCVQGACVDTLASLAHCGGCDPCGPDAVSCTSGNCVCPTGATKCGKNCCTGGTIYLSNGQAVSYPPGCNSVTNTCKCPMGYEPCPSNGSWCMPNGATCCGTSPNGTIYFCAVGPCKGWTSAGFPICGP